MKRLFDFVLALVGLILSAPLLVPTIVGVWLYDRHTPFYRPLRVGKKGRPFRMLKLRSMVVNADKAGASSTSNSDQRITPIGHFIRRFKLDELSQLWNVVLGDMSMVGPRPTLQWEIETYSEEEKALLEVKPGITNLASIVFSDEGQILKDSQDPDADYLRWIRPGKSQLALISIHHQSLWLDLQIIVLTAVAIVSKRRALSGVVHVLQSLGAPRDVIRLASRQEALGSAPPITQQLV